MFTAAPRFSPRSFRLVGAAALVTALAGCGGSSTSLVDEAVEHADATCSCEDFDCTTDHIQWFNKVSITQEDDLDALSEADRATYLENSLRAAGCQNELR